MIPRYARPEMVRIWAPETKFAVWLEIEALACEKQEELGAIPKGVAAALRSKGKVDIGRIDAIEREVRHDVIAFLTSLAEQVGDKARFIHHGMTSSDVLDTCLAVQMVRAADLLLEDLDRLLAVLERRARESKAMPCIGRSHGVHAEPTTMGLKFAFAHAEFARGRARLERARDEAATCKISGAVGTFASIDPAVEAHVAGALGLRPEPVSTQVVPRDRHAAYFAALALLASSVERLATEFRHLQRTEVREAEEAFGEAQKGSSAMPHKRNPVLSENLTGLARTVRAMALPAMENVALWHERDISHSSVERMIAPDATVTLDFALHRLAGVADGLVLHPEAMRRNLESLGGLHASGAVMLALVEAGLAREDAYRAVQRCAMRAWDGGGGFADLVRGEPEIAERLDGNALEEIFGIERHLRHVDAIFERVFGSA